MITWRPDDWDEITFNLGFDTSYKATSGELCAFNNGIESGADAMLEALRKMGRETDWYDPVGKIVTIPANPPEKKERSGQWTIPYLWTHPTTKVIESGYFCPKCGYQNDYNSSGHDCLRFNHRGIRY